MSVLDAAKRNPPGVLAAFFASGLVLLLLQSVRRGYSLRTWNLSEWLINYSGGLVRRGLPGAGLLALSRYSNTSPYWWVLATSLSVLAATLWIVGSKSRHRFHGYVLFSPILFGGAIIGDYWLRKDIVGVLCLLGSLKVLFDGERLPRLASIGLVNALSSVMILSHEAYGFYALPLLILVNAAHSSARRGLPFKWTSLVSSVVDLAPAVACFLLAVCFKGDRATAVSVQQSWAGCRFPYDSPTFFPKSPVASIDAMGWTTREGLQYPRSLLTSFSHGIYVPLAWAATLFLSGSFLVRSLMANGMKPAADRTIDEPMEADRDRLSLLLLLQLIAISPLFVLGWDYGRWIFLWGLSSVVGLLYTPPRTLDVLRHIPLWTDAAKKHRPRFPFIAPSPYLLLIFAVPKYGWTVESYVDQTPVVSVLRVCWQILGWLAA